MTTEAQPPEEQFAELIIKHGPRSPIVHRFMDEHRGEPEFLRYAVRLTQLQEYAAFPELLKTRRNHMNDTDEDVLRQLDERMKLYGAKGEQE